MIITKIEQQKKNSTRCSIFVDDQFAFGVTTDVCLRFSLYAGKDITENEIAEIKNVELEQHVKTSALRFRSYRPRSKKEIEEYLTKKGFDEALIDKAIVFLSSSKLLDDEAFAQMLCRDKLHLKPVGKQVMRQHLFKKGIDKETTEKVLDENYTQEQEEHLALAEAEKKLKRLSSLPPLVIKRKLYDHLLRRGYNSSLTRTIINQLLHQ
jgi:regulatory protein